MSDSSRNSVFIQSIKRAVDILKLFEKQPYYRITDIANELSLHKSTAFGIVSTLEHLGLLSQDQKTGQYCLGLEVYRLGMHVDLRIGDACYPSLAKLASQTGETVNLVLPHGTQILYIEKIESPHSMRICTKIGQTLPMFCTAAGKAILSFLPPQKAEAILNETVFVPYTGNTMLSPMQLQEQFAAIREEGYAVDQEELEPGLVCVAIPLLNNVRHPIGAISVSGPVTRMQRAQCLHIRDMLFESRQSIHQALGYGRT